MLQRLRHILPRSSFLTLYTSFIRSHLDYADITIKHNVSLHQKLESIQYNSAPAKIDAKKK